MMGAWLAALTTIENVGSAASNFPSLTAILMPTCSPSAAAPGVPLSRPVVELNEAQGGLLTMLNVNAWPSGSDAVGVNAQVEPTCAWGDGVPLIVGGWLAAGFEQTVANLPLPRQSLGSAAASRAPTPNRDRRGTGPGITDCECRADSHQSA